jgi:hypothetical protein
MTNGIKICIEETERENVSNPRDREYVFTLGIERDYVSIPRDRKRVCIHSYNMYPLLETEGEYVSTTRDRKRLCIHS